MLKALLIFLNVTITIYLIGNRVRRNPKIDAFVGSIEWKYAKLNSQLEQASIRSGLLWIRKIYGWLSVVLITFSLFAMNALPGSSKAFLIPFNLFLYVFLAWFSIKWTLEHKTTLLDFAKNNALYVFVPTLAGLLDTVLDTPFTSVLAPSLQHVLDVFKLPALPLHPFAIGVLISCFMIVSFVILYFTTWFLTTPLFICSIIIIMIPIYLARLLAAIDNTSTFLWLAIFIWIATVIWLA